MKLRQEDKKELAKTKALTKAVADEVPKVAVPTHKPHYRKRVDQLTYIEQSYDQLDGEWLDWLGVARKYDGKVPSQDRYDVRHNILIELARARARDGEPIPLLRAYRIASLTVALYWRKAKRIPTILSLDQATSDYEGNEVKLMDTVADDNAIGAIDIDAKLDATQWRLGCPIRLIEVADKKAHGIPLDGKDRKYLCKMLKRYQKTLF